MIYDTIIIGAGPAGLSAAIYTHRKGISTIVLTGNIGGQMLDSGHVDNYLGFKMLTGVELASKFEEHVKSFDFEIKENEFVKDIEKKDDVFIVKTGKSTYEGKSIIIASGMVHRELGVEGEEDFKRKGVAYCVTCDGPLFANRIVAVVGGGNSALDAALQLERIAKKIYLINLTGKPTGDKYFYDKLIGSDKVEFINKAKTKKIIGENFVKAIVVDIDGQEKTIDVDGVFVEIGYKTNIDFIDISLNERKEISIDNNNMTNIKGIFAAGDVTSVKDKQVIIAAGEGAKAAIATYKYLENNS